MYQSFSAQHLHTVTDANINFYTVPFVHPRRTMHQHDFIYVLNGEWALGQEGEAYPLAADSLLILFADRTHYGITPCLAGTKTMYFHASFEEGDLCGEEVPGCAIPTWMDASGNQNVKKRFAEVVHAKLTGEQRKADLLFELLLCELTSQKMCLSENEIALKIQSILHGYPERFFGNRELADMLHVSVKTAETKFKAAFGKTIHQYTLEYKIKEAISYFERFPGISVKEVAYNLGFCDEYHFSKQFLKHTGQAPSRYKTKSP